MKELEKEHLKPIFSKGQIIILKKRYEGIALNPTERFVFYKYEREV